LDPDSDHVYNLTVSSDNAHHLKSMKIRLQLSSNCAGWQMDRQAKTHA